MRYWVSCNECSVISFSLKQTFTMTDSHTLCPAIDCQETTQCLQAQVLKRFSFGNNVQFQSFLRKAGERIPTTSCVQTLGPQTPQPASWQQTYLIFFLGLNCQSQSTSKQNQQLCTHSVQTCHKTCFFTYMIQKEEPTQMTKANRSPQQQIQKLHNTSSWQSHIADSQLNSIVNIVYGVQK